MQAFRNKIFTCLGFQTAIQCQSFNLLTLEVGIGPWTHVIGVSIVIRSQQLEHSWSYNHFGCPYEFQTNIIRRNKRLRFFVSVPCVPSPVMFTTAGMLPPIQPILPLQPVTLPVDHIIPFHHHLVPQDTIEDSSNIQNQS